MYWDIKPIPNDSWTAYQYWKNNIKADLAIAFGKKIEVL